jgi:flagellar hook-associated protein 2
MTISGSSSIDVNTIVSQLMTIEQRPLVALQKRESDIQSKLTAFGRVQSAVSSLQDSVDKLRQSPAFSAAKASVSGDGVTAVAGTGAVTGRFSVSVSQLARAQSMASAALATADTSIGTGALTIRSADGTSVLATINVGDTGTGTLGEIRDEINAAGIAVKASLVNDGGKVRLVLASSTTGAANGFQVSADPGLSAVALTTTQAAQDASFSVNGLALTSASNTVGDVVAGLTVTLTKQPPAGSPPGTTVDAEIAVDLDTDTVRTGVSNFVKAYNDLNSLIGSLTSYDPTTKTAAVLNGESVLRRLRDQVRSLVTGTKTGGATGEFTRLSDVGVAIQKDGSLALNSAKFDAALTADSAKVARLFTTSATTSTDQGFAVRTSTLLLGLLGAGGVLDARQQGLQSSIHSLDAQQVNMQTRLTQIEARLREQYSKLDALVTGRQSQSNALANALAGLPVIKG